MPPSQDLQQAHAPFHTQFSPGHNDPTRIETCIYGKVIIGIIFLKPTSTTIKYNTKSSVELHNILHTESGFCFLFAFKAERVYKANFILWFVGVLFVIGHLVPLLVCVNFY